MKRKQVAIVTGAGGFLGQHLVFTLEQRGYRVIHLPHKTLSVPEKLAIFFKKNKFDYLFHLAARGNMAYQKDDHDKIVWGNYIKSYNLLEATKDINYRAFINVSTSSVGLPHQTLYSATKLGVEALCVAYADEYKKPIISVRPSTVIGKGEQSVHLIPTLINSCETGAEMPFVPDATHDFIDVRDVVDGMIFLAEHILQSQHYAFNISNNQARTNLEVSQIVANLTKKPVNVTIVKSMRSYDNSNWQINNIDILKMGWKPKYTLEDSIASML